MARLTQSPVLLVGPPKPGMPPSDVRRWLIDNDLWDDGFGTPPEMHAADFGAGVERV
jgi:hypothetical protein